MPVGAKLVGVQALKGIEAANAKAASANAKAASANAKAASANAKAAFPAAP